MRVWEIGIPLYVKFWFVGKPKGPSHWPPKLSKLCSHASTCTSVYIYKMRCTCEWSVISNGTILHVHVCTWNRSHTPFSCRKGHEFFLFRCLKPDTGKSGHAIVWKTQKTWSLPERNLQHSAVTLLGSRTSSASKVQHAEENGRWG